MSNYILDLRKIVGKRPLLQVGAGVIVVNGKGQILLQKRADNSMWGYHGGSVELDERTEDAAKRELFEETGLVAEELELFGVFSGEKYHYTYPNGDEVSNIDIVYLCNKYNGSLKKQDDEVMELKFFSVDEIPENIFPPNKPVLQEYINKYAKNNKKDNSVTNIEIDAGNFFLVEPSEEYAEQIREYRQAFLDADSSMDGCGPLRRFENPIDYIAECRNYTVAETVPKDFVPATQFFLIRKLDNCLVGMIQVRHCFNDYLSKYGGHIGYSVKPNERRKGYATLMLKAVLPYCKGLWLERILISCIDGNIGSEKAILNNGGVYESTVQEPDRNRSLKRFWITL